MVRHNGKSKARKKKIIKAAKGYIHCKTYRKAKQFVIKAGQYQYRDRKCRKRDMRALWIIRINAFLRTLSEKTNNSSIKYSTFINILKKANKDNPNTPILNRKILARLAYEHPAQLEEMVLNYFKASK